MATRPSAEMENTANNTAVNTTNNSFDAAAERKENLPPTTAEAGFSSDSDSGIDKDAQAGIQDIEATTTVWSKTALIAAYVWIWIICMSTLKSWRRLTLLTT